MMELYFVCDWTFFDTVCLVEISKAQSGLFNSIITPKKRKPYLLTCTLNQS